MSNKTNRIIYLLIGVIILIMIIIGILLLYFPKRTIKEDVNLNVNAPVNLNIQPTTESLDDMINYLKNSLNEEEYNYIKHEVSILVVLRSDIKNSATLDILEKNNDNRLNEILKLISDKAEKNLIRHQVEMEKYFESVSCLAINNIDACNAIDNVDDGISDFDFYRRVCRNYHWGYQSVFKRDTTLLDEYSSAEFPDDPKYKGIYLAFAKNDISLCPKSGSDKIFCEAVINQDYDGWEKALIAKGSATQRECMLAMRVDENVDCDENSTFDEMSIEYKAILKDIWKNGITHWQAIMQNDVSQCDKIPEKFFPKNICLAVFNNPENCRNIKIELEQTLKKYH